MKKKFTVHLDAVLVIIILFVASVGLNVFQQSQLEELSLDNEKLQWQDLANSLNMGSKDTYIKKLEKQLHETKLD